MAVIVLALSCMPCMDRGDAKNAYKAKSEISTSHSQQQHDGSDGCSPFCQCSCCAGFSAYYTVTSISTLPIIYQKQFTSHLPVNTINISLPIWQPPQLVS